MAEPDDRKPMFCKHRLATMWLSWQKEWFAENLSDEQQRLKHSKKTSIWNAFVKREGGTKHFVMAVWQTGLSWLPPLEMLNGDRSGALEHVATHFAQWTRQLARSVAHHKRNPRTEEAIRRSGSSRGRHGLTPEDLENRENRRQATSDYYHGLDLLREHETAQNSCCFQPAAASTGKKRCHTGKGAAEHSQMPRLYEHMRAYEQWLVHHYRNGTQQFLCLFLADPDVAFRP